MYSVVVAVYLKKWQRSGKECQCCLFFLYYYLYMYSSSIKVFVIIFVLNIFLKSFFVTSSPSGTLSSFSFLFFFWMFDPILYIYTVRQHVTVHSTLAGTPLVEGPSRTDDPRQRRGYSIMH